MLVDFSTLTDLELAESKIDPVRYCDHFLGEWITVENALDPESPWEYSNAPLLQQRRIMRDIAKYKLVSVAGSNTWGKSHMMVRIASWWFDKWDECLIVVIAPRMDSINKNFAVPFGGLRGTFAEFPDKDNQFVYMPDANYPMKQIFYTTAAKQESIAGWHAFENKLFLFDEASGIHTDIWNAVFPMATRRDSKWVVFGNPLRDMDEENYSNFKETSESDNWKFHSLSALDHPNYIHKKYVIEHGMEPDFPEMAAIQYGGEDSIEYQARVLGKFAIAIAESMYALYIDKVMVEPEDWNPGRYKFRALGIDPAGKRSGDSTVIHDYRFDYKKGDAAEPRFADEKASGDDIVEFLKEETADGSVNAISVDIRGIGNYLPDLIRKEKDILVPDENIYEYDGVRSAVKKDEYDSKKDEDAFDLRERMQMAVLHPNTPGHAFRIKKDPKLYLEMGTRKFGIRNNRRKLVDKKKGTGESPDHFESFLCARDAMMLYLAHRRREAGREPPSHASRDQGSIEQSISYDSMEEVYV